MGEYTKIMFWGRYGWCEVVDEGRSHIALKMGPNRGKKESYEWLFELRKEPVRQIQGKDYFELIDHTLWPMLIGLVIVAASIALTMSELIPAVLGGSLGTLGFVTFAAAFALFCMDPMLRRSEKTFTMVWYWHKEESLPDSDEIIDWWHRSRQAKTV